MKVYLIQLVLWSDSENDFLLYGQLLDTLIFKIIECKHKEMEHLYDGHTDLR